MGFFGEGKVLRESGLAAGAASEFGGSADLLGGLVVEGKAKETIFFTFPCGVIASALRFSGGGRIGFWCLGFFFFAGAFWGPGCTLLATFSSKKA